MIDFQKLIQIFPFASKFSTEDLVGFFKHVKVLKVNEGDVFFKEGSLKNQVFFINKGLIRAYCVNEKGEEITTRLRCENQIIASHEVIFFNQPSRFSFQALEDSELFVTNFDAIQKVIENNPKLETGRRYFLKESLAESLKTVDNFILLTPEQRYIKFIEQNPSLINRVPNKYIANVLGITPVSLSRIRKRIASKK